MKRVYKPTETVILVEGLHLQANVGVPAVERASPQNILLDLHVTLENPEIASDSMKASLSYKTLVVGIEELVRKHRWSLLEKLAEAVAESCFYDERVARAWIRIRKYHRFPACEAVGVERVFERAEKV